MKKFYYIDKNNKEQLDLIEVFEYATNNNLSYDECVIALSKLNKYVTIKPKKPKTKMSKARSQKQIDKE